MQSMPLPKTCPDPGAPSGSGSRQVTQTFPHTRLGKRGSRIFKRLGEEPARLQRGQQRSQLLHAHLLCPSYQNVCAPCSPKQSGAHASPVPNHFAGSNVANPTISQLSNCEGKKKIIQYIGIPIIQLRHNMEVRLSHHATRILIFLSFLILHSSTVMKVQMSSIKLTVTHGSWWFCAWKT